MGGPSQSTLNTQNQLAQSEIGIQQQAVAGSAEDRAARQAAQAPAISFNTALSSGDPQAVMTALAPEIANISKGKATAKEGIYESVGPGAARDVALAQNEINSAGQVASLKSNAQLSSYDKLATIGSGLGSFSLQELGAGISSGQAASSANQVSISAAEQSKASTLGFLGELAGAGATLGAKAIGCWIAEAIYGKDDIRTHLVRAWLNGPFRATWYGRCVMAIYIRYGERIAAWMQRFLWLKKIFKPVFDIALHKAAASFQSEPYAYRS